MVQPKDGKRVQDEQPRFRRSCDRNIKGNQKGSGDLIPPAFSKIIETMRKVKAIIERAADGNYSIYMDVDDMSYLVTGTGKTVEEALKVFQDGYEDMRQYYAETGKKFEEVEFEYQYDVASFLQYYAKTISLAGLERITGVNQKQLGHYISGYRHPSAKTAKKIEDGVHKFSQELSAVRFA